MSPVAVHRLTTQRIVNRFLEGLISYEECRNALDSAMENFAAQLSGEQRLVAIRAAAEAVQSKTSLKPRIVLADDHFLIAETLSMLLARNFDVVSVITDAKLIVDEVARLGRRSCCST
jgi:hypothetical protein